MKTHGTVKRVLSWQNEHTKSETTTTTFDLNLKFLNVLAVSI